MYFASKFNFFNTNLIGLCNILLAVEYYFIICLITLIVTNLCNLTSLQVILNILLV